MLVDKVHGIHFIINGHLTHAQADPQLVNHTQIFMAGARGEFLGQAELFRKKTRRLYSRYQLIPLKTDFSEKPEVQVLVGQYKEELQCALQPPVRAELAKGPTSSPEMTVPPLLSFVGEKGCATCHPREHQHWASTAHARAYQTLAEKDKTSDVSCLASTPPDSDLRKTPAPDMKMSSVSPAMDPEKAIPTRGKTWPRLMNTNAVYVIIQRIAQTSIMINMCRKSCTRNKQGIREIMKNAKGKM